MRVGVDIRALLDRPLTGVGEYTQQLLGALLRDGEEDIYTLFSNSFRGSPELPASWPASRYHLRSTRIPNKLFNLALRLAHRPLLDRQLAPVDLFFAPNLHFLPVSKSLPFVVTVHDLSFLHYKKLLSFRRRLWHRLLELQLLRRADGVIAVSESTAADLQKTLGIPAEKIFVIHSGVTSIEVSSAMCDRVRNTYRLPEHFLLALSTLEPRKNFVTLLDAYAILRSGGARIDLVIAGAPGWSRSALERKLAQHPFRSSIHLLPYVSSEEKHCLYRLADLFLYLSVYEGFGFPPVEAAVQGTPVIAGHHSSLSEIMGKQALLVDVYNAKEVAKAAALLLQDPLLRKRFTIDRSLFLEKFSWQRAAALTRKVFFSVINNHAHRD